MSDELEFWVQYDWNWKSPSDVKAAFAKNTNLSEIQYEELYKETDPLVRYFLSKNSSLKKELKVAFALESPTFTFTPYGGDQEEETLK